MRENTRGHIPLALRPTHRRPPGRTSRVLRKTSGRGHARFRLRGRQFPRGCGGRRWRRRAACPVHRRREGDRETDGSCSIALLRRLLGPVPARAESRGVESAHSAASVRHRSEPWCGSRSRRVDERGRCGSSSCRATALRPRTARARGRHNRVRSVAAIAPHCGRYGPASTTPKRHVVALVRQGMRHRIRSVRGVEGIAKHLRAGSRDPRSTVNNG